MKNYNMPLKILIGGETNIPGWTTMNIDTNSNPDIISDIVELKNVSPNTVSVFYLSHVLEHIRLPQVVPTLSKLYDAMIQNSTLYISVPNLDVIFKLLSDYDLNIMDKINLIRIIYGGQINDYDYHYFGYNFEILSAFLLTCGFTNIRQVDEFNIHLDTSSFRPYKNIPISLNIICNKI